MTTPATESTAGSSGGAPAVRVRRVALVGNPNTGKTTLFNLLCGVRSKTANFPGSTVEARVGTCVRGARRLELVDLPGVYGLNLDLPESQLCRDCIEGRIGACQPDAMLVVLDANNLHRNLQFAAAALRRGVPTVVALNMADLAARRGLTIDIEHLAQRLDCEVVAISARRGRGIDELLAALDRARVSGASFPDRSGSAEAAEWADAVLRASVGGHDAVGSSSDTFTDRIDAAFTHPVLGMLVFVAVMSGLFLTIFWLAKIPMDLIELLFSTAGDALRSHLSDGAVRDLLVDGVVGGLAGVLVFIPQICLLFFLLSLLEDTGYLARAAFVMDRVMCRFGLPGQAFVPLLSSHACALPGIMATRLIPDRHDRLATILVAPFMSCTARLPVYVLLTSLLFAGRPLLAGMAFAACYLLGAVAALLTALLARRTILRGRSRPMVLELPSYKWPSLRSALLTTLDRALVFVKNAGTVIMAICVVMWWLSAYPRVDPPPQAVELRAQAAEVASSDPAAATELEAAADGIARRNQQIGSFAGRIGAIAQPVFQPLGFDRQLTVAVLTSFMAREVFVSTMAVLVGTSDDVSDRKVVEQLAGATRDDGTPVFTMATSASLLVFFVLAMQCLPTLAVTRRETGSWRWPILQFGWMSGLAWALAFLTHAVVSALGG
ncbi:MAG: ferrous iron transporter B [Phycisphaerales bacterium]|nr:ferrous iron transporter B [Phycisphaerales bacterium]